MPDPSEFNEHADEFFRPRADSREDHGERRQGLPFIELMWGGPKGPGLVYTVSQLALTVATQGSQIADLKTSVEGANGAIPMVRAVETKVDALTSRFDAAWKVATKILIGLAVVGIGTLLIFGHAINLPIGKP